MRRIVFLVLFGSVPLRVFTHRAEAESFARQHGALGAVLTMPFEVRQ